MKDKSANERFAYDQKISQKEAQIEKFQEDYKRIERMFDEFELEMTEHFHRLQNLQEEMIAAGDSKSRWAASERQGKQHYIRHFLDEQRYDMNHHYRMIAANMEDERSKLQAERNALPWE